MKTVHITSEILFIDLEASGLGPTSFPIELGWAWLSGPSGGALIKPATDWDLESWDEDAQALHGITLSELRRDGGDARDVADALVRMVSAVTQPFTVVSDAPHYDQRWLSLVFDQTPALQPFDMVDDERLRWVTFGFAASLLTDVDTPKPLHRAESDAVRLRDRWAKLAARQGV